MALEWKVGEIMELDPSQKIFSPYQTLLDIYLDSIEWGASKVWQSIPYLDTPVMWILHMLPQGSPIGDSPICIYKTLSTIDQHLLPWGICRLKGV